MIPQTRIRVFYQVANEQIMLGETLSEKYGEVVSMWLRAPNEEMRTEEGFRIALYDDGGRHVANKTVSMGTADLILAEM